MKKWSAIKQQDEAVPSAGSQGAAQGKLLCCQWRDGPDKMLLIDIPARVERGQRKLMFSHDGCSSPLVFFLLYNRKRPDFLLAVLF